VTPLRGSLLDRRLLIVAGKGGVGKTTVACALALVAAQAGKRTLLAEVDGAGRAAWLLGIEPGPAGAATEARPSLSVMSVDGSTALAEYLEIIVPVKRVLQAVLSSRIYQYFVAAAPGLKELMTIGKIWYEAERSDDDGQRRWDLVIFDAPATGHSLQYLRMPHAAHEAFGAGLVGRESQRIVDLLTDARRTAVNLVTTAEEMPVNETLEMYEQIRAQLHMPLGLLFVNRVHRAEFTPADLQRLALRIDSLTDPLQRAVAEEAVSRGREEGGWSAINQTYMDQLRHEVAMPLVEIPFAFAEEFGAAQVQAIAAAIAPIALQTARRAHGDARP
jgi:anion-transporting  ArsA/GET3 family ATPase